MTPEKKIQTMNSETWKFLEMVAKEEFPVHYVDQDYLRRQRIKYPNDPLPFMYGEHVYTAGPWKFSLHWDNGDFDDMGYLIRPDGTKVDEYFCFAWVWDGPELDDLAKKITTIALNSMRA